jgi:ABC-type glutathione transport system ATPase component
VDPDPPRRHAEQNAGDSAAAGPSERSGLGTRLLAVQGLRVTDPAGAPLVDDVHFTLNEGEAIGIVGESGSGKTLISKAIVGLLPRQLASNPESIELFGVPLNTLGPRQWQAVRGSKVSAVFQDPGSYLDLSYSVESHFREVLHHKLGVKGHSAHEVAASRLAEVQIADPELALTLYPHELSGGMAQRVVLALALLERPQLLIADEVTTALDVTVEAEILDLLLELRRQYHMSLVVVSHDLSVVARLAASLIVLRAGRVIEAGQTAELLRSPSSDYLRMLIDEYTRLDIRQTDVSSTINE